MGLAIYTVMHVLISLVGIGSGLIVLYGLLTGKRLENWTMVFLATNMATNITGFFLSFPWIKALLYRRGNLYTYLDRGLFGTLWTVLGRRLARNICCHGRHRPLPQCFCLNRTSLS